MTMSGVQQEKPALMMVHAFLTETFAHLVVGLAKTTDSTVEMAIVSQWYGVVTEKLTVQMGAMRSVYARQVSDVNLLGLVNIHYSTVGPTFVSQWYGDVTYDLAVQKGLLRTISAIEVNGFNLLMA
ncbi:unnamed protein product [Meganyctiphanes norvegica]|uniref:Uncharacterized protein n=1 Tax=Meganyctiphanes norvegica TaxID=48144 RepID=A0AAV2SFL6_MEGNR